MLGSFQNQENLLLYAIVAFSLLLGLLVNYLVFRFLKRVFSKTTISADQLKLVRRKARLPLLLLLLTLAVLIPVSAYDLDLPFFQGLKHTLIIILIISITWILIKAVQITRIVLLSQYDMAGEDNLQARKVYTQYDILEKIIIGLVMIIALSVALMTFDSIRRVGLSLFASAGVVGIIVGLAAQKIIGVFLAGVQIAVTQPIRIDDVVIVENEWGWVEEINLTYVVVRIWDKRRLIVPTTYFIEKPFQNWTRVSADILGTVFIHTDYTMTVDEIRNEVDKLLKKTDLWDGKVNVVQVTSSKETTMEVRVLVSAKDSPTAWDLRVYLREKLIEFIQKKHPESLPKTRVRLGESGGNEDS